MRFYARMYTRRAIYARMYTRKSKHEATDLPNGKCGKCTVAKVIGVAFAFSCVFIFKEPDFYSGVYIHRELSFPLVYSVVHVVF